MLGDQLAPVPNATDNDNHLSLLQAGSGTDKRASGARRAQRIEFILRPSSTSQRHAEAIPGFTKDISQQGCGVICSRAPRVGDIYLIEPTGTNQHALHGNHARCVRCQMLDEEAFSAGFTLLSPLVNTSSNGTGRSATSASFSDHDPLT